jgi:hypothetical protein
MMRDVGISLVIFGAVATALALVLFVPDIAQTITRVGQLILAVGGSILVVSVVTWALANKGEWPLPNAIAFTSALFLIVGIFLAAVAFILVTRPT